MSSTSTAGQAVGPPEGAVGGATFDETRSLMNDLPAQMFGELMFFFVQGLSNHLGLSLQLITFFFHSAVFVTSLPHTA